MTGRCDSVRRSPVNVPSAHEKARFVAPIGSMLSDVECILLEQIAQAPSPLNTMLRQAVVGGKRLRPTVILLLGSLLSGGAERLVQIAAAVETLHVATLIHDDIMDGSPVRRGRAAIHVRWSVRDGVLAGDYLLAASAERIARLGDTALMEVFARVLTIVCGGQMAETHPDSGTVRGRDAYRRDIEAKTASMIAGGCEMSAMAAGAARDAVDKAREFGRRLGIAFQMTDDVLDLVGDEQQLGKPRGSDLRQGLLTLPTLLYLEQGKPAETVVRVIEDAGERSKETIAAAIEMICASGAVDAAADEACRHADAALAVLSGLGPKQPAETVAILENALRDLVAYAVLRQR